jgi:hypothetical protein
LYCCCCDFAFSVGADSAKPKEKNYDHAGAVVFHVDHDDYTVSLTTQYGTTTTGCNSFETSMECHDDSGSYLVPVQIEGDTVTYVGLPTDFMGPDPLREIQNALALESIRAGSSKNARKSFQFRSVTINTGGVKTRGICVPYQTTDKKGKVKNGEACYAVLG